MTNSAGESEIRQEIRLIIQLLRHHRFYNHCRIVLPRSRLVYPIEVNNRRIILCLDLVAA